MYRFPRRFLQFPGLFESFTHNFLGTNHTQIYPHMCAKFGHGPTVMSKKRGYRHTRTQTQRDATALYSRLAGLLGFARDSSIFSRRYDISDNVGPTQEYNPRSRLKHELK